jgi:cytochrome c oxidase subunit 2
VNPLKLLLNNFNISCDAPIQYQYTFQDPATPMFEGTLYLHDIIWTFLVFIVFFVSWMLFRILVVFKENANQKVVPITQNMALEVVWTMTPALILCIIAGNSISHLYSAEEALTPSMDVVITGNQWFWTYEFMAFTNKITFESHLIAEDDLVMGELRNLEVDNPLIVPVETNIRLIVNSNDVIHSWAVPSLGIKIDAVPGRTNTGSLYVKREGRYYGQCSEICGKSHALMPIVVVATNQIQYLTYLHYMYMEDSIADNYTTNLSSIQKNIF